MKWTLLLTVCCILCNFQQLHAQSKTAPLTTAPTSSHLAEEVAELMQQWQRDANVAWKTAGRLVTTLSADDLQDPSLRLQIFEVYCFGAFSLGVKSQALEYAQRAVAIATVMHDDDRLLVMRGLLAIIVDSLHHTPASMTDLLTLERAAFGVQDDRLRALLLNALYERLLDKNYLIVAVRGLRKLGALIENNNDIRYMLRRFLINIYRIHEHLDDADSMRATLQEILRMSEQANDTQTANFVLHQLGRLEGYQRNFALSDEYLLRARNASEQEGDVFRVFMANRNLARNHLQMKDHLNALMFANAAYAMHETTDSAYFKASTLLYQAQAHLGLGATTSAQTSLTLAESWLAIDDDSDRWRADYQATKSAVLQQQGEYEQALVHLKAAAVEEIRLEEQSRQGRLVAMHELSNANLLDYRTISLEQEKQQADQALKASRSKGTSARWLLIFSIVLLIGAGLVAVVKWRDAAILKAMLQTDSLTSALSRFAIEGQLQAAINAVNTTGQSLTVLLLDIDNLKLINDSLGHSAGDQALQHTVQRIRETVRHNDLIGRLGGDEFLLVMPGANLATGSATAERIRQAVHKQIDATDMAIAVSIGIATWSSATASMQQLMNKADEEMYASKRKSKATVR
jgi:diguanylate cyclase (GGDEF)-like protein